MVLNVDDTKMPEKQETENVLKEFKMRIEKINQKLSRIHESLARFQSKYGLKNREFKEKYSKGELRDDMDFMEWHISLELYEKLQEEKTALLDVIGR